MSKDTILINAYHFMDDGRPQLHKQLVWRDNDLETNLASILSMLKSNDEVCLISQSDYKKVICSNDGNCYNLHNEIRSYSINIWKGDNA